jgi:hypothetical protein
MNMKVIKVYEDLQRLKRTSSLPDMFLQYLELEWNGLFEAFTDDEERGEFSLESHGKQVVLEPGDRLPKGLGEIYWPEYVEKIQVDEVEIFRMYVMEMEDYGVLYYWIAGSLDEESETMLREYTGEN